MRNRGLRSACPRLRIISPLQGKKYEKQKLAPNVCITPDQFLCTIGTEDCKIQRLQKTKYSMIHLKN
jgi:hypothetical protein